MTVSSLSAEALEKIRAYRWDRIIEKHEGRRTGLRRWTILTQSF